MENSQTQNKEKIQNDPKRPHIKCEFNFNKLKIAEELQDNLTVKIKQNNKQILDITPFTLSNDEPLDKTPNYVKLFDKQNSLKLSFVWKDREILNQNIEIPLDDLNENLQIEDEINFSENIDLDIFEKNLTANLKLKWINGHMLDQVTKEIQDFDFEEFQQKKKMKKNKKVEKKKIEDKLKELEEVKRERSKELNNMKRKKENCRRKVKTKKKIKKTSTTEKLLISGPIGAKAMKRAKKVKSRTPVGYKRGKKTREKKNVSKFGIKSKEKLKLDAKDFVDNAIKRNSKDLKKRKEKLKSLSLSKFEHLRNKTNTSMNIKENSYADLSSDNLRNRYRKVSSSPKKKKSLLEPINKESKKYIYEYKSQIDYLKNIVYSLDLKLKGENILLDKNLELETSTKKNKEAREELRKAMLETTQELKNQSSKFKAIIENFENLEDEKKTENLNLVEENKVLKDKILKLESRNSILEHDFNELKVKKNANMIYEELLKEVKMQLSESQRTNLVVTSDLSNSLENLKIKLQRITEEKRILSKEVSMLEKNSLVLQEKLVEQKSKSRNLKSELDSVRSQLDVYQAQDKLQISLENQKILNENILNKIDNENNRFLEKMKGLKSHIINQSQKELKMNLTKSEKLDLMSKKILNLKRDLENFKKEKMILEKKNTELVEHTLTLEQLLCVKEDVHSQLKEKENLLEGKNNQIKELQKEIMKNTKVLEVDAEKIFELEMSLGQLENHYQKKEEVGKILFFLKKILEKNLIIF